MYCDVLVTFTFEFRFETNVPNEPVPFVIIVATYAIDADILFGTEPLTTNDAVVCDVPVTAIADAWDAVNKGSATNPPPIIVFTISKFLLIVFTSFGVVLDEVIWEPLLTLIGLYLFQVNPVFCANKDLIELNPFDTIPSIIENVLPIKVCCVAEPLNEDVAFVKVDNLKLFSSL